MKARTRLLLALLLAAGLSAQAQAPSYSFDFKAEKKKLEGKRTATLEHQTSVEKWCYTVTVQNHSFKDVPNVDIKYIIYYKKEGEGSKVAKEKHLSGSVTAAMIQNNGNFVFDTEGIELVKSELMGTFYYTNGAKARSRDSITGIWLRLYQNGTMIGEYSDPPELSNGKWDVQ